MPVTLPPGQLPPGYQPPAPTVLPQGQLPPGFDAQQASGYAAQPAPQRNPAEEALGPLTFDAEGRPSYVEPPPGEPQRGVVERSLELGLQGVGRGAADFVGAPMDLLSILSNGFNSLINTVTGGRVNFGQTDVGRVPFGSNWIAEHATPIAEALGLDVLDPAEMTPHERLLYNINRFGSNAALSSMGLARLAMNPGVNTAMNPRAPTPSRTTSALLGPYFENPTRAFVGDVAAGAGAGAGNYAYQEYASPYMREHAGPVADAFLNTIADTLGGIGGVTAANMVGAAGNAGVNAVRNAVTGTVERGLPRNTQTGLPFSRRDADIAGNIVQRSANNPAEASEGIARFMRDYGNEVPRTDLPTTGLMSNDVGLVALENAARTRNPVPYIARDQNVQDAALSAADRIAPRDASGRDFTNFMENDFANLQTEADALAAPFRPNAGQREQAIEDIDRMVTERLQTQQRESADRYAAVDPGRTEMVDITPVAEQIAAAEASIGPFVDPATGIPTDLGQRIAAVAENGGQAAVGDIVELWPDLSRMLNAASSAGNVTLAKNLRALRDGFGRVLQDAAAGGSETAQRALDAQTGWQEGLGSTFGSGAAERFRRDFNVDRIDREKAQASQTAGRFLRPGQPETAAQLRQILNGEGEPAVHRYLVSDMAASGVVDRNGMLNPDRLRAWRDKWGSVIAEVSPMTERLINQTLSGLDARTNLPEGALASEILRARRQVANPDLNRGAFEFAVGNNPTNAVRDIFASGDPEQAMNDVLRTIGSNQEARDGLKAAVREYLRDTKTTANVAGTASGERPLSWAQLDQMFNRYESTLAAVFSPEEMNALQQAHAFLRPLVNRSMGATVGSPTAERSAMADQFWRYAEIGLKARFGILKGGGMLRTLRLASSALFPTDAAAGAQQLITQMFFDPELAMHLLNRPAAEVGTPKWNATLNRLLGVEEGMRQGAQGDPMTMPQENDNEPGN